MNDTPLNTPNTEPVLPPFSGMSAPQPKKKLWILLAAVIIVVLAGAAIAYMVLRQTQPQAAAAEISDKVAHVTIGAGSVTPATVQVKKGQEVTWTNSGSAQHQLTADQDTLPGFGTEEPLSQGDSYTYVFETSGTFHYYDPNDPSVYTGTITVE